MDLHVSTHDESAATIIEDVDDTDDTAFENERCGICTDVVIDRGVLDCCHHWFCFACIDNWATITNLCPLCKNEFQLITCLPVYDTIGSIKAEDHSLSRDDDWCIQGKNNTLSFPSYYIDEDAVICLDGDGCKIRSGLSTAEEDSTFDTSIACDSCDIWYHAFCVGFNPESTASENSWLCPRCITDEGPQKSDVFSRQNLGKHSALRSADLGWTIDPSFSGKVSVSVADAGETAVVVSMVEGQQKPEANKTALSEVGLDFKPDRETKTSLTDTNSGNAKLDAQLENGGCIELICNSLICSDGKGSNANAPEIEKSSEMFLGVSPEMVLIPPEVNLKEKSVALPSLGDATSEMTVTQPNVDVPQASLALSTSEGAQFSACYPLAYRELKASNAEETICKPCYSDGFKVTSPLSHDTSETKNELSENKSVINLHLGISVSSSSVEELVHDDTKYQMPGSSSKHPSESADEMIANNSENMIDAMQQKNIEVSGSTRKYREKIQPHIIDVDCLKNLKRKTEMEAEYPANKAKSDGKSQILLSRSQVNASVSDNSHSSSKTAADYNDDSLRYAPPKEATTADIMSIVQETDHRFHDGSIGKKIVDKSLEKRDSAAGLRVKKIMRRVGEKKESSILVQKLRKEIREAVQDKTSDNIGNDKDFDGKLLTAFRAAIVKPRDELVNNFDRSLKGAKNSLLQKGKIRENLTKKIYGTATGKRRRAWDRDWEIEFWKHRCTRTKPEKVETLHSVLELLRKATNSCSNDSVDEGPEGESTNSILSRVYLADASVFPRKDDIKPLSAFAGCSITGNLEQKKGKGFDNQYEKESQTIHENNMAKSPTGISKVSSQARVGSSENRGQKLSTSNFVGEASCRKGNLDGLTKPTPISESSGSEGRVRNSGELASQSNSATNDKRKWALEVLARKNASTNRNASKGKEEDRSVLKGKFPLFAQLPVDMRPVLASSRHNKVPVSVRQAQLYRITEHYLRRANLPIIRRTADTELAVADAVNVEKEIFERSNSKLVYINLCSQAVSQRTDKPSDETIASHSAATTAEVTNQVAEETSSDSPAGRWSNVEEALKLAGLSSDSPPNSPYRPIKDSNEEDGPQGHNEEQGLENVLDLDSHPELDIYGDFEYDLEDDGYVGLSKLLPQEGDSRMKVVLSTLKCEESDKLLDSKHDTVKPQTPEKEVAANDHANFKDKMESGTVNAMEEIRTDAPVLPKLSEGGIYTEPSLAEYEELYGPEKEPVVDRMSDEVNGELSKSMDMEAAVKSMIPSETEKYKFRDRATASEFETEGCAENSFAGGSTPLNHESFGGENSPTHSLMSENPQKERKMKLNSNKLPDPSNSISKKVEVYIKEHIRPLCKSGVITVEQYRWAVGKTTDKVMKYHHKAKNANFLIKEGEKVKKLAEQYVEAAQSKEW